MPRLVTLKGAGHMLMSERPDEVLHALGEFARGLLIDAKAAG